MRSWSIPVRTTIPIEQMQLMKFNGEEWELFGDVITGEVGHDASR